MSKEGSGQRLNIISHGRPNLLIREKFKGNSKYQNRASSKQNGVITDIFGKKFKSLLHL